MNTWKLLILSLLIYQGDSLVVSTNNLTWIAAQKFCSDRQESLIPGTKEDFPSPHWIGYYHRLSDWIHVLGCYGDQNVESLGVQSNHTLVRGSVGLCQERCPSYHFALKSTTCLCLENVPHNSSLPPSQCDYNCPSDDDSHVNDCGGSATYNVYRATPSQTLPSERTVNCVVLGCYEQYAQIHTNNCTEDLGRVCESEESTNKTLAPDDEDFKSWSQTYKECRVEGSYLYGEVSLNEDPRVLCNKLRNFKSNTPETWLGVARQVYLTKDRGETTGVVINCQTCFGQTGCSFVEKCNDISYKAYAVCGNANDLLDTTTVMTTIESSTTETTENPTTTSESPTTIESHSTTESPITTKESPIITSQTTVATESPATTLTTSESPTTTTKSLETTESPTTIESFTTTTESLPPTTTTESFTTITTAESFTTTTTTESPTTTTESFKTTTTTESPTTTGSQTITESPATTTKTESPTTTTTTTTESSTTTKENPATESPTTTMESSEIIEENFTSTEYPEISSRQTAKIPTESTTTDVSTTSVESPTTNVTEEATSFTTLSLSTSIQKRSTTVISTKRSITATSTQSTVKSTTADPVSQGPIAPVSQTKTDAKTERAIIVVVSVTIVGILMAILGIVFKRRKKIPFRRKQRNPVGITYRHFNSGISSIYDDVVLPEMDLLNFDLENDNAEDIKEVGAYYQDVQTEDESENIKLVTRVQPTEKQGELINSVSITNVIQNGGRTREQAVVTDGVNIDNSNKKLESKNQNSESDKPLHESPPHKSVINVKRPSQSVTSGERPEQTTTGPNSSQASNKAKHDTKKNVSLIQVSKT
ncbi:mucin-2-like [Saccostrea cucullata]|uniref:mucin-2-like n=1 Tax=Saccostrea cuccullata TaxID=36930 RepID=UPI002ED318CC